jgi:TolA-binding protein
MNKYLAGILGCALCTGLTISCSSTLMKVAVDTITSKDPIGKLIADIDSTQKLFNHVDKNVGAARNYLFDFTANQERKAQLQASEKELAEAEGDAERLTIELKQAEKTDTKEGDDKNSATVDSVAIKKTKLAQRLEKANQLRANVIRRKDEAINFSQTNGDLEKLRLSGKQVQQISNLIWNLKLASLRSQYLIENSGSMITNGAEVVANAKPTDLNYVKVPKLKTAVENDLPELKKRSEYNLATVKAFTEATNTIRKNNPIPDPGNPTKDDKFKPVAEDF